MVIDSKAKGKIIGFGENCAYAELENGLEGVVCNEDLSWTRKVNRAQEVVKRSHSYEFKVMGLDRANRKVILGMKQLTSDPWPQIVERYPINKVIEAEVVKMTNFGIFVKIEIHAINQLVWPSFIYWLFYVPGFRILLMIPITILLLIYGVIELLVTFYVDNLI